MFWLAEAHSEWFHFSHESESLHWSRHRHSHWLPSLGSSPASSPHLRFPLEHPNFVAIWSHSSSQDQRHHNILQTQDQGTSTACLCDRITIKRRAEPFEALSLCLFSSSPAHAPLYAPQNASIKSCEECRPRREAKVEMQYTFLLDLAREGRHCIGTKGPVAYTITDNCRGSFSPRTVRSLPW